MRFNTKGHNPYSLAGSSIVFDDSYTAKVVLQIAGPQTISLDVFDRPLGEQGYLTVGFGPILIYCHAPTSVLLRYDAFEKALPQARSLFPLGYRAPQPGRSAATHGHPVISAITCREQDRFSMTGYAPTASRDGRPALVLTVGALTLSIRDLVAFADLHRVWNDALTQAPGVWPSVPLGRVGQ